MDESETQRRASHPEGLLPVAEGKLGPYKLSLTAADFERFEPWAKGFVNLATSSSLLAAWPALLAGTVGLVLSLLSLIPSSMPLSLRVGYPLLGLACLIGSSLAAFAIKRSSLNIHATHVRELVLQSNALQAELAPLLAGFFDRDAAAGKASPDYRRLLGKTVRFVKDLLDFRIPDGLAMQLRVQFVVSLLVCIAAWLPLGFAKSLGLDWFAATLAALAAIGCCLGPLSLLLVRKLTANLALVIGTTDGLVGWLRSLRAS